MKYIPLSKSKADDLIKRIEENDDEQFEVLKNEWQMFKINENDLKKEYLSLRVKVLEICRQENLSLYNKTNYYNLDVKLGLCLYKELPLSTIEADNDDIWRYLSCIVFPDITYLRYPKPDGDNNRINKKRFFSHPRRIWLKTLWWYIHLSWQGSEDGTYSALQDLGTDTISDFIERPGKGYRINLFRALIGEYSKLKNKNSQIFNKIQKQNLINCQTIEPALCFGGEKDYVRRLFKQLDLE